MPEHVYESHHNCRPTCLLCGDDVMVWLRTLPTPDFTGSGHFRSHVTGEKYLLCDGMKVIPVEGAHGVLAASETETFTFPGYQGIGRIKNETD